MIMAIYLYYIYIFKNYAFTIFSSHATYMFSFVLFSSLLLPTLYTISLKKHSNFPNWFIIAT